MQFVPTASDQPRGTPQTHVGNVTPVWPGHSRGHHSRARAWEHARDARRAAPAPSQPSLPAVIFPLRPSACDARSRSLLPRFTRSWWGLTCPIAKAHESGFTRNRRWGPRRGPFSPCKNMRKPAKKSHQWSGFRSQATADIGGTKGEKLAFLASYVLPPSRRENEIRMGPL